MLTWLIMIHILTLTLTVHWRETKRQTLEALCTLNQDFPSPPSSEGLGWAWLKRALSGAGQPRPFLREDPPQPPPAPGTRPGRESPPQEQQPWAAELPPSCAHPSLLILHSRVGPEKKALRRAVVRNGT